MKHQAPSIFITFANDEGASLKSLEKERKDIKDALKSSDYSAWVDIEEEWFTTPDDIARYLNAKINDNLAIFHYSGHAHGKFLNLHDADLSDQRLAKQLAQKPFLKLVFLNACETIQQADAFLAVGIPALIVTALPVEDDLAGRFAINFYQAFSQGQTIKEAFTTSCDLIKESDEGKYLYEYEAHIITRAGRPEGTIRGNKKTKFPWVLIVDERGEEVLNWKLGALLLQEQLRQGSMLELGSRIQNQWYYSQEDFLIQHIHEKDNDFQSEAGPHRYEYPIANMLFYAQLQRIPHLVLKGEGGMGKTITFLQIWLLYLNDEFRPTETVPIYLSLNEYDPGIHEDALVRMICTLYLGEKYPSETTLNEVHTLLKHPLRTEPYFVPAVILLLDGFNEIKETSDTGTKTTSPKTIILQELYQFCQRYPGVQIVLSTRYSVDPYPLLNSFQQMELQFLSDQAVGQYLVQRDETTGLELFEDWYYLDEEAPLKKQLRHPLSLQLYGQTARILATHKGNPEFAFKESPTTLGELLWNYHQSELVKIYRDHGRDREAYEWYRFLLQEMVPSIAYSLAFSGVDTTSETREILQDTKGFSENAGRYFKLYPAIRDRFNTAFLAANEQQEHPLLPVLEQLTNQLGVLIFDRVQGNYRFEHDYFRDFYAALYMLRDFKQTRYDTSESQVAAFHNGPMPVAVNQLLGEILGDHHNAPLYNDQQECYTLEHYQPTLLDEALREFGAASYYGGNNFLVYNILEAWNAVRGNLAGADLRGLNLQSVILGNKILSLPGSKGYLAARLDRAMMTNRNLFNRGHRKGFKAPRSNFLYYQDTQRRIKIKADGKYFISFSLQNDLKLWMLLGKQSLELQTWFNVEIQDFGLLEHSDYMWIINRSRDINSLLNNCSFSLFNPITGAIFNSKIFSGNIGIDVKISLDEQRVAMINQNKEIHLFSLPELNFIADYVAPEGVYFSQTVINTAANELQAWLNNGTLLSWNFEDMTECLRYELPNDKQYGNHLFFAKFDGKKCWYIPLFTWLSTATAKTSDDENLFECIKFRVDQQKEEKIKVRCSTSNLHLGFNGEFPYYYHEDKTAENTSLVFFELGTGLPYRMIEVPKLSFYDPVYHWWPDTGNPTHVIYGSGEYEMRVYHLAKDELSPPLPISPAYQHFDFSPDGGRILAVDPKGIVVECDLRTGQDLRTLFPDGAGLNAQPVAYYFPDGQQILVGAADGTLTRYTWQGEELLLSTGAGAEIKQVAYSSDGKRIFFTLQAGYLQVFDRRRHLITHTLELGGSGPPRYLGVHDSNVLIRVGILDNYGKEFLFGQNQFFSYSFDTDQTTISSAVALAPQALYTITGDTFGKLTVINRENGEVKQVELRGKITDIQFSHFHPDRFVVSVKLGKKELEEWQRHLETNRVLHDEQQQVPSWLWCYYFDLNAVEEPLLVLGRELIKSTYEFVAMLGHVAYSPTSDHVLLCEHYTDHERKSFFVNDQGEIKYTPSTPTTQLTIFSLEQVLLAKQAGVDYPILCSWTLFNSSLVRSVLGKDGTTVFLSMNLPVYDPERQQNTMQTIFGELSTTDPYNVKICRPAGMLRTLHENRIRLYLPPNDDRKILGIQINGEGPGPSNWYAEYLIEDQLTLSLQNVLSAYPYQFSDALQADLPEAPLHFSFSAYPGMHLGGCTFYNTPEGAKVPLEDQEIIRSYGGIFNQVDRLRWEEFVDALKEEE